MIKHTPSVELSKERFDYIRSLSEPTYYLGPNGEEEEDTDLFDIAVPLMNNETLILFINENEVGLLKIPNDLDYFVRPMVCQI
jgi:hypothetical protein